MTPVTPVTHAPPADGAAAAPASVSFAEALRFWLKLGFISFGGPAGQIAIMHTELVERRRWISEQRFFKARPPMRCAACSTSAVTAGLMP